MRSSEWTFALMRRPFARYGAQPTVGLSHCNHACSWLQAYMKGARAHHPDKGGSAAIFTRIQHAYAVLSNPALRKAHDLARNGSFSVCQSHQEIPEHKPAPAEPKAPAVPSHSKPAAPIEDLDDSWWSDDDATPTFGPVPSPSTASHARASGSPSRAALEVDAHEAGLPVGLVEAALLEVLAARGIKCHAATQLVGARGEAAPHAHLRSACHWVRLHWRKSSLVSQCTSGDYMRGGQQRH